MTRKIYSLRWYIALLVFSGINISYAQQDPQFTQYMYNPGIINPAYASSKNHMTIFGNYRAQWIGMDGAPKTANISLTAPIGDSGLAYGVHFLNDRIGVTDENTVALDLSYAINLNDEYKLAFGVKGQGNFISVDYTKLSIYYPMDPSTQADINGKFTPNVGVGAMLYSDRTYFGISAPSMITTHRYKEEEKEVAILRQKTTFYATAGHIIDINQDLLFKPAIMMKATSGAPFQVDLTANFLLYDKFTAGLSYRWDAAVSGLVGFQINKGLMVGYSYDAETSNLARYNSGSHEIFLKFDLFSKLRKYDAPRFF
ncbi:MAG: type IX secretion system membrane protein PorP/SprF [Flavobacteriaceae bacterium]|jgi:type IX secretion system PorP/SprF family membrane protein|nr:type IX secretion system membrane protein PorP/SprF [Flavobacteriaceae bacterium]